MNVIAIDVIAIDRLDTVVDQISITKLIAWLRDEDDHARGYLAGCIDLLYKNRKSATVCQLFVHRAYRNRGVGRALINECCRIAEEAGCKSLGLQVSKDNVDARSFYYRVGGFAMVYEYDTGDQIFAKVFAQPRASTPVNVARSG